MRKLKDLDEVELGDLMSQLAYSVELTCDREFVERPLFCLVLFNDPEIGQYVGNCRREDMIKAMREVADRLEKNQDLPRTG